MSELVGFRCRACDNGFVIELLTRSEVEERQRKRLPLSPVRCPQCGSDRVERTSKAA